ncbi:MAG: hypothetical protein R2824_08035 [Saprospiraceae bacterium]|nr:hypothetical protein [Lewinella sp.]
MQKKSTLALAITLCLFFSYEARSQNWQSLFEPIFEQADSTTRDSFLLDLSVLSEDPEVDGIDWQDVYDGFFSINLSPNVFLQPIDSFNVEWSAGQDTLNNMLGNSDLGPADSTEVVNEYDRLNGIWLNSLDTFNNALATYEGPVTFDSDAIEEGSERYDKFTGLRKQSMHILERSWERALDGTEPKGIGDLMEVFNTTFSSIFDLELAFGLENGTFNYYNEFYAASAKVIRVGSMPQMDQTWEAKWSAHATFFNVEPNQVNETTNIPLGLNPLRYGGDFTFMFNPALGRMRTGGQFRLYTSLGIAIDSYVPPHRDPANPKTANNVGKTTGYGPEVGTGFIINTDAVTFYTYASKAYGGIAKCPGYEYNAEAIHAGLRFGDKLHLRYDLGKASWAPEDYKQTSYNRFTVGLKIDALYR